MRGVDSVSVVDVCVTLQILSDECWRLLHRLSHRLWRNLRVVSHIKRKQGLDHKHMLFCVAENKQFNNVQSRVRAGIFMYYGEFDIMLLTRVLVSSGILVDPSHPSEPRTVWELGTVGETGRCFPWRSSIWLSEDWIEARLHFHHTLRYTFNFYLLISEALCGKLGTLRVCVHACYVQVGFMLSTPRWTQWCLEEISCTVSTSQCSWTSVILRTEHG